MDAIHPHLGYIIICNYQRAGPGEGACGPVGVNMIGILAPNVFAAVAIAAAGRIYNDNPPPKGYKLFVSLPRSNPEQQAREFRCGSDGAFTLDGITPGSYQLRIVSGRNLALVIPEVLLDDQPPELELYWPNETDPQKRADSASQLFAAGKAALDQGDFQAAVDRFMQAIKTDCASAPLWAAKSLAEAGLKRYDDAVRSGMMAIRFSPRTDVYWNNLGGVFYRMGRYSEAVRRYERAAELNPDGAGIYMANAGAAYVAAGSDEAAANAYAKSVAAQSPPPGTWYHYAECLYRLNRMAEAKAAFQRY